jgi:Putative MetA-pathway of phenol degradation
VQAQTVAPRATADAENAGANVPAAPALGAEEPDAVPADSALNRAQLGLFDRFWGALSEDEDPDGPINTDRPTFTPANTVVPRRRLQFESGFTYNYERTSTTHASLYDFPELAMRYGFYDRVEFRTFWLGPTYAQGEPTVRSRARINGGLSNMEIGFKWQLLPNDTEKRWRPTTALITSIYAPTGGNSLLSSDTVEPYLNLIYGWNLSDKLTFAGSTGYLGFRQQPAPGSGGRADSFQRYHQSLVAFYSVTERSTLFYEWYILMFTNATDNRPTHFMDGGLLYRPTPNTQLDIRAGFGLSGRPDDVFTGVGFSVRF